MASGGAGACGRDPSFDLTTGRYNSDAYVFISVAMSLERGACDRLGRTVVSWAMAVDAGHFVVSPLVFTRGKGDRMATSAERRSVHPRRRLWRAAGEVSMAVQVFTGE